MKTPLTDPEKFDLRASFLRFSNNGGACHTKSLELTWYLKCRPILIKALIDYRTTHSVLEHLIEEGIPLASKPENRLRTVQRWLARTREYLYLPRIPDGGKMSNPGYKEALRRWKIQNPTPTDEEILAGWRATPVDYSDINFLSQTDAYAPKIEKSPKTTVVSPMSSSATIVALDTGTVPAMQDLPDSPPAAVPTETPSIPETETSPAPKKKLRPSQIIGDSAGIDFDARVQPTPRQVKVIR